MGLRDGGFAGLTFVRGCVCEDSGGTWILEIRGILWGDMGLMRANFSWVFDFCHNILGDCLVGIAECCIFAIRILDLSRKGLDPELRKTCIS